ncbi:MAG: hypothetical protein SGJ21_03370 [Alphaproteobacteria bacterium]|nr:hypothetical protein [Alphaproteobacteria bacterium]
MNTTTRTLVAAALLASIGIAHAQGGPPMQDRLRAGGFAVMQHDGDSDGNVTKAEFDAGQKARFAGLDADKDGYATGEEIKAGMQAARSKAEAAGLGERRRPDKGKRERPGPGAGGVGGQDADKDDKLSFEEFAARGSAGFIKADANADGVVTAAEAKPSKQ